MFYESDLPQDFNNMVHDWVFYQRIPDTISTIPSCNLFHGYWTWPSRNSELSRLCHGDFSSSLNVNVYQRVKIAISDGFPMVFLWFSHFPIGFPLVFPFSHGFSRYISYGNVDPTVAHNLGHALGTALRCPRGRGGAAGRRQLWHRGRAVHRSSDESPLKSAEICSSGPKYQLWMDYNIL